MLPPEIPRAGEPIRAEWMRRLIEWIKADVIPKGDGYTIQVSGNIVKGISKSDEVNSVAKYTGYFKLILESQPVSDEPGANVDYYVNIVDGATYDAEQNPVSGKSVCKVNNVTYQLDPYRSGMIAETSIFALKYTAPVAADPDAVASAAAPPSRAAMRSSNTDEVGFMRRV